MRAWCAVVVIVAAGCYDPHAPIGAPCSPAEACPQPLVCTLVGTCVLPGDDAPTTANPDSPVADGTPMVDARPDARVADTPPPPPDAPPVPWTLVQVVDTKDASTISIAPTLDGDLLIVGIETNEHSPTAITDTGGDTFTQVPGAVAINTPKTQGLEIWIAPAIHANSSSIQVMLPISGSVHSLVVWEVANLRATAPIDNAGSVSDGATTTSPLGAQVTTTASGDFVVGIGVVANFASGLAAGSPFTEDRGTNGNGWAHLTSASAPPGTYQPHWSSTSGTYCAVTVALFAAAP